MSTIPPRPLNVRLAAAHALAAQPPPRFATVGGAAPAQPSTRIKGPAAWPALQQRLAAGVDDTHMQMRDLIKGVYNQNVTNFPAFTCVPYSTAGLLSLFNQQLYNQWRFFDAEQCYAELGGTGSGTVRYDDCLNHAMNPGLRDIATGARFTVTSWIGVDAQQPEGQAQMKAAINLGSPCLVALNIPADFDSQVGRSGDCQSTQAVRALHQLCVFGYTGDRFYFLNSQGKEWGDQGTGSISWAFLSDAQQEGIAYGATVTDTPLSNAPLDPRLSTIVPPTGYELLG
jgi:hypothetical protein